MKSWILAVGAIFLLLGCATSTKTNPSQSMLMVMSYENAFIVNGVEIQKSDTKRLIAELNKTGQTNLLLTNFAMGDLLQVSSELKAAGFSMYYIDNNRQIKSVNVN